MHWEMLTTKKSHIFSNRKNIKNLSKIIIKKKSKNVNKKLSKKQKNFQTKSQTLKKNL